MPSQASPLWTPCGFDHLTHNPRGWLVPTDDYWRLWLQRPELAPVEESCAAERCLHEALMAAPPCPAVIVEGRLGGSAITVAAVNALASRKE